MEKGKAVAKLSLLQKGGASSHQKGCHVGQGGGNRKSASPRDSSGSPPQADTQPQRPRPRAPTQCCQGGRHQPFAEQT